MKEKFENRKLTGAIAVKCKNDDGTYRMWEADKKEVCEHIVDIVRRYMKLGYRLTLRQLHYQLVTKNWIVNHDTAYKKLGDILDDCRYSGLIDWDAIEDRGRVPHLVYHADSVAEALQELHEYYRRDRQEGQANVVEVWTEKDALSGILKRPTEKYHVRLVVNKGYTSSSAAYQAYDRVIEALTNGKKFTILYFGDHDPSGLDMVRDITDRIMNFLSRGEKLRSLESNMMDWWSESGLSLEEMRIEGLVSDRLVDRYYRNSGIELDEDFDDYKAAQFRYYIERNDLFRVIAMGLTREQIRRYNLPPNPTKLTDSRADKYIKEHGKTCWEVDALDPDVLNTIVDTHIQREINLDMFADTLALEKENKKQIQAFIDNSK